MRPRSTEMCGGGSAVPTHRSAPARRLPAEHSPPGAKGLRPQEGCLQRSRRRRTWPRPYFLMAQRGTHEKGTCDPTQSPVCTELHRARARASEHGVGRHVSLLQSSSEALMNGQVPRSSQSTHPVPAPGHQISVCVGGSKLIPHKISHQEGQAHTGKRQRAQDWGPCTTLPAAVCPNTLTTNCGEEREEEAQDPKDSWRQCPCSDCFDAETPGETSAALKTACESMFSSQHKVLLSIC